MIKRGKRGRLQMICAGKGRWTAAVEAAFLERLRLCGNVRSAARAVGFAESSVWARRRQWPALAEAMEAVLEEAELALEHRIAYMANNLVEGEEGGDRFGASRAEARPSTSLGTNGSEAAPFDADFAMRFLKWREEKRRGRGQWAPRAKAPSIEEVTEKIVLRVEAIKRHRAKAEQS